MKEYVLSALLILTFIIAKCVCLNYNDNSSTDLDSSTPSSEYKKKYQTELNSTKFQTVKVEETVEVPKHLNRSSRDLRIPFRPHNRNAEPHTTPRPNNQRQPQPRVFSHPKLRPGTSPDLQAQQQQYRPAYEISQGSAQKQYQHVPRTHHRNNQPSASRPQDMTRGPLRLPGKEMTPGQQTQRQQFLKNANRQQTQWRQSNPSRVPAELLHHSSSDNKPEVRPPTRDRVIDVFHHIPVSPTPNPNIYGRIPTFSNTKSSPFQTPNPAHMQTYFKQTPPPTFVPPASGLQMPHQPGNVLQNFPVAELNRRPVVLPTIIPTEMSYPFQHKFVQSEPLRNNQEQPESSPNTNTEVLPLFNPTNKEQFLIAESQSQTKEPADSISIKDLIVDAEKLRVIHTVEGNPANKNGTVKKYWNFRQENFGLEPPKMNAQPIYPKMSDTNNPAPNNDAKKKLGPELLISLPGKDVSSKGNVNLKVLNDEIHLVASHILPNSEDGNKKIESNAKEFYYIDNKPGIKLDDAAELPPQFMNVASVTPAQIPKNSPSNQFMKATDNPVGVSDKSVVISNKPEITTHTKIPQLASNSQVGVTQKSENIHNGKIVWDSLGEDPIHQWDHSIKYIPADIFRANVSTENKNNLKDNRYLGETFSNGEETNIENYHHSSGPGLYARNKAQFQKFEDSIPMSELPDKDSKTDDIHPKQYFRGPQHFNTDWMVFDDQPISNFGHRQLVSTSVSYLNSWLSNPTTAIPPVSGYTRYIQKDNSQKQVINALHLANKVFGRKNYTRKYPQITTTTMKPESKRMKFTYASVTRSTTESLPEVTSKFGTKKFFNFKTGTTSSAPSYSDINSENPVTPSMLGEFRIPNQHDIADHLIKLQTNFKAGQTNIPFRANYTITLKPNSGLDRFYRRRNQSSSDENRKPYYINLKPVTRPYSSSSTTSVSFTIPIQKQEPTESYDKVSSHISSKDTTRRFGVARHETTSLPPQTVTYRKIKEEASSPAALPTIKHPTETTINLSTPSSTIETTSVSLEDYLNHTDLEAVETVTKIGTYRIPISSSSSISAEVVTPSVNQEQEIVDSLKSMKLKMQEMMSKGMRHFMPLVLEMSTDVALSSDCTFSLLRLLRGVRSLEQWAIKMMDASSKVPEGILFGTISTFGSYDECLAIKTPKTNMQIPYTGKYCSINIRPALPENERHFTIQKAFRRYPKLQKVFKEMNIDEDTMAYYYILKHRIGLCIPSTCTIEDLHNVTDKLAENLKMKISVGHCETSERPSFTKGQVFSMCGVFIAFFIVVIGTILDMLLRHRLDHDMDIEEVLRKKSFLRQFSFAFSAYRNACKILNTSIPSYHLSSLHGIKFLSMTWIMLGHVYYCKDYLTVAGLNKVRDLGANLAFQVVLNSGFAADTFFFLSGLLVVYSTLQYLEMSNGKFSIVGFYIKRYCRLTPAFLMISGVILLGPLIGSGPVWNETLEPFVTGCENYWWTNLFYFSNFVPTAKTCVPHGWFLACDMQFYLISPIIILGLYRRPKMGLILIALGIITSMVSTGFITFIYTLPPVSLFSLPDPKDINDYLDTIGYKPYAHYASYCIGMAVGFFVSSKEKITISRCMQIFGWIFTITTCLLVVYGTWDWNSGNLPDWSLSVAYATSSRTIWTLGVAWITVICYSGHGGTINDILSWHGFIPLSRLCYLAYLIHPLLMYLYASYIRSPVYFSQYFLVYLYFGHLCVTFGLAFIFSLAFELPFLNLEKIVSSRLDQNRRKRRASFSHHHTNWQHPEFPELKDSVVLMRRRPDFTTHR